MDWSWRDTKTENGSASNQEDQTRPDWLRDDNTLSWTLIIDYRATTQQIRYIRTEITTRIDQKVPPTQPRPLWHQQHNPLPYTILKQQPNRSVTEEQKLPRGLTKRSLQHSHEPSGINNTILSPTHHTTPLSFLQRKPACRNSMLLEQHWLL